MEIFGVGTSEILFILILALIILGPKDMQKAGKTIGKWLRSVVTSDGWKVMRQTTSRLRTLPHELMRQANEELDNVKDIGEIRNELKGAGDLLKDWDPRKPVSTTRFQAARPPVPTAGNEEPARSETKPSESDFKADA
jgi:Sec-independent protein translocase protein TatA